MPNSADKIANLLTRHDININRMEAGMRRKVVALINGMNKEVIRKLKRVNPTAPTRFRFREIRLNTVMQIVSETVAEFYKEIKKWHSGELRDMSLMESQNLIQTMNDALKVGLVTGVVNENVLKELAKGTLIEGAPSKDWWKTQEKAYVDSFKRRVSEGIVLAEPVNRIAKDIQTQIGAKARRDAITLVRTSAQAVLQASREETYQQNQDVVKGVQWSATLDTRTSEICRGLDDEAWTIPEHKKMKGTTVDWRGPPPAHYNCRSTLIPIMRPWSEIVKDKRKGKILDKLEGKRETSIRQGLDGKPPEGFTYNDWLKGQDQNTQIRILGVTKHKLWKQGKVSLTDMIDQSHRPLTVKELQNKVDRRAR